LTERGRRTRDRILGAATELFSTHGFSTTSVDDVLRASGAGKSQFYHYFDSKADLGRAVLRAQRWRLIPYDEPDVGHIDDWGRIEAWFDGILRAASRDVGEVAVAPDVFDIDARTASDPLRIERERTLRLRRRLLWRGLRRMKRRGELVDEADPERLAAFAASAIEGGLHFARAEGSVDALRHALGETYAHFRSYAAEGYGDEPPNGPTPKS
jgi:TetR/AcrR family transcriptional repressor of nem operon